MGATASERVAAVCSAVATVGWDVVDSDADATGGFIPEELRQRITAPPPDTTMVSAKLRRYQVFGAQYAIHQERSMLGDEMGLGKTVQALAVIAHLAARGQRRFLVICPASVQVNWLKEIARHTTLTAHSLHGADRDETARRWLRDGGIAVTTFGTLSRLPKRARAADVAMNSIAQHARPKLNTHSEYFRPQLSTTRIGSGAIRCKAPTSPGPRVGMPSSVTAMSAHPA